MITNSTIIKRIEQYAEVLENQILNKYPNEILSLFREDIKLLEKENNYNIYTQINLLELKNVLNGYIIDISYDIIANSFMKIFLDYYFGYLNEKLTDETFNKFTVLLRTIFFSVSSYPKNELLNLRRTKDLEQNQNNLNYITKYYELLGNDEILYFSDKFHEEGYRQCIIVIFKILIKNKQNNLLIDFYKNNKLFISPKLLIEFLYKDKTVDLNDEFYDFNFIKFVESLIIQIDNYFLELQNYWKKNESKSYEDFEEKWDENSNKVYGPLFELNILIKNLLDIFELLRDEHQFKNNFYVFCKKNISNKKSFQLISNFLEASESENYMIELTELFIHIENCCPEISISCIIFIEYLLNYLFDLKDNDELIIFDYDGDLDKFINYILNTYIKIKSFNNNIINNNEYLEFKEKILIKYQKLEEREMMKNLFLSNNLNKKEKREILKNFFNSSFLAFTENNILTTCKQIYSFKNFKTDDVDKCVEAIIGNETLTNQLVSGEILIKPLIDVDETIELLKGDYTSFLTCQIKSIERYIKIILFKYYPNQIYNTKKSYTENIQVASIEDLNLECGTAFYSLDHARKLNNDLPKLNHDFFKEWVNLVRNGYFHIHTITTISDLKIKRIKTAYWLMYLILTLGNKGIA